MDHSIAAADSKFNQIWDDMDPGEKRAFSEHIIEELSFEPECLATGSVWVKVTVKLILREAETFRIPTRGRGGRDSEGLDSLSPAELTQAYYYMNGCSDADIAHEREVSIKTVKHHKKSLIRRTGASTLKEALDLVAPLVEARKDELTLGRRSGIHYRHYFNPSQIQTLKLLAQRLSVEEIAERTGKTRCGAYGYIQNLYTKLGVHCAKDAVTQAQRLHLIDGPTPWSDHPTPGRLVESSIHQV